MDKAQERLAERLFDEGTIKFGMFRLKLHEKNPDAPLSPVFINLRTEENPGKKGFLSPDLVGNIGRILYSFVNILQIQYKYIVGIPWAGDPFAEVVYHANRVFGGKAELLKMVKEEKEDGNRKINGLANESKIIAGSRVLLIDDLITKADSKLEAIKVLEDVGLKVENIIVIIDREQGGADELKKAGYLLHSIFNISDLLRIYLSESMITKQKYDEVMDYIHSNRQ